MPAFELLLVLRGSSQWHLPGSHRSRPCLPSSEHYHGRVATNSTNVPSVVHGLVLEVETGRVSHVRPWFGVSLASSSMQPVD